MGLDKKKTRSINIKFPLKRSSRGAFATNETTIEAIADDLKILILTNHGERPCHSDFGADLRSLLFEQQTDDLTEKITDRIVSCVSQWMSYVTVLDVEVLTSDTDSGLRPNETRIRVKFQVGNTNLEGDTSVTIRENRG